MVAKPLGITFAVLRQFDDLLGYQLNQRVRAVREIEPLEYIIECAAHRL